MGRHRRFGAGHRWSSESLSSVAYPPPGHSTRTKECYLNTDCTLLDPQPSPSDSASSQSSRSAHRRPAAVVVAAQESLPYDVVPPGCLTHTQPGSHATTSSTCVVCTTAYARAPPLEWVAGCKQVRWAQGSLPLGPLRYRPTDSPRSPTVNHSPASFVRAARVPLVALHAHRTAGRAATATRQLRSLVSTVPYPYHYPSTTRRWCYARAVSCYYRTMVASTCHVRKVRHPIASAQPY